jgi:nitrogen-specific signal transduction histidine kinase
MENNLYAAILENDLNPFILFDSNGKLKDFNKEAEFLFNYVQPKDLFDLAVENASQSFGFNKQYVHLEYNKVSFYAMMVGYLNDEEISLRLYKEVEPPKEVQTQANTEITNIYSLIELSKGTMLLQSDLEITEMYDISIPEMKININNFLLTLNDTFETVSNFDNIELRVYIKTGEYQVVAGQKHKIVCFEITSFDTIDVVNNLKSNAKKAGINLFIKDKEIRLEFPMIL